MPNRFRRHPVAQAIALGIAGFASLPVPADLSLNLPGTAVQAIANRTSTLNSNSSILLGDTQTSPATVQFPAFSASQGVLTGISVGLSTSKLSHSVSVQVNGVPSSPPSTFNVSASSNFRPLIKLQSNTPLYGLSSGLTINCTNSQIPSCVQKPITQVKNSSMDQLMPVPLVGNQLDAYVGETGTVVSAQLAPQPDNPVFNVQFDQASETATVKEHAILDGTLGLTYSYLNHAVPVFYGKPNSLALTLDFGTVLQGANRIARWKFSNSGLTNNAKLDLVSVNK